MVQQQLKIGQLSIRDTLSSHEERLLEQTNKQTDCGLVGHLKFARIVYLNTINLIISFSFRSQVNIFILLNVTRVLFTHLSGNEDADINQIR